MPTHQMHDRRSLALHRLVASRLTADPTLLNRARTTLERWRPTMSRNALPYLDAWEAILDDGLDRCVAVLVEDTERATALRQASPFAGILSPRERADFLKHWRDDAPERA